MISRLIIPALAATLIATAAPANTLDIAKRYIGMSEHKHRKQLRAAMGFDPRGPWCGAFLTMVIRKAGKRPPKAPFIARSWLRYGKPVKPAHARPGDIVVARSARNHVGVFSHRQGGKLCMVSGNSRNMVRIGCYGRILGVRR